MKVQQNIGPQIIAVAVMAFGLMGAITYIAAADDLNWPDIVAARKALDQQYAQDLSELADKCVELGLAEEAATTRQWIIPRDPHRSYLFIPSDHSEPVSQSPSKSNSKSPSKNAGDLHTKWKQRFSNLRDKQATALFDLARQSIHQAPDLAYQLLHEVIHENPRHAEARQILGHKVTSRGWDVPARRIRSQAATIAHPNFGWRRGSYWRIESEHFRVTSNHSAREGIKLVEQLEELFAVWRQLFFAYWSSAESLQARFQAKYDAIGRKPSFNVVLFRNREEYIQQLSKVEPKIAMSLGYYLEQQRTAYFYFDDGANSETWLHEATHQLFQEINEHVVDVGVDGHFWVIEGIAQYMESLQRHGTYVTVGGLDSDRLQFARARHLTGDFHVPLSDLVTFSRQKLQDEPRIRSFYSHAAGLSHFFMDGESGMLRAPFIRYLRAIYAKANADTVLTSDSGRPYGELDSAYHAFLKVRDSDLVPFRNLPLRRNLYLGRTFVTDAGLEQFSNVDKLEWLDLSYLKVNDQGVARFQSAKNIKQLSLENTSISDTTLAWVAGLKQLEELDLSGTRISDAGLEQLKGLKRLKIVWLAQTPITDAGLEHVVGWSNLEKLELTGTEVTEQGRNRLRARLPKVQW